MVVFPFEILTGNVHILELCQSGGGGHKIRSVLPLENELQ
jgi:hypothetical protein